MRKHDKMINPLLNMWVISRVLAHALPKKILPVVHGFHRFHQVDGSLAGLGEATISGADDAAAETNGRTNDWWRLDQSSRADLRDDGEVA